MKFSVVKLGRVAAADFDIKPLTVFIGKTNTNKTWTAYALYGILRSLTYFMRAGFSPSEKLSPLCPQIDSAVEAISRDIAERLAEHTRATDTGGERSYTLEVTRERVLRDARIGASPIQISLNGANLAKVLAVDAAVVEGADAILTYDAADFLNNGKVKSLKFVSDKQNVSVLATAEVGLTPFTIHTFSSLSALTADSIREQITVYVRWLAFAIFHDALGFPAERKAISAFLSLLEPMQRDEKVRAALNVPLIDFIRFMLGARQSSTPHRSAYSKSIDLLERAVMNGKTEFQGPPDARVFNYTSASGPPLQVHASASLVRALSGLDLYLRNHHLHEIIVIDEPEMNAHPDAQLKLVELFALLANQGMRVIVTTHSPYFLDHLNNLIAAGSLSASARAALAPKTKLGSAEAFISSEKVAAYLFQEDGIVRDILEDGIIDLNSFSGESDFANNLYSDILKAREGF